MGKLDFIIVGAAKCGTTSLFNTLGTHTDIFLPENKEPWHFSHKNVDLSVVLGPQRERIIKDDAEYKSLFADAKEHELCGEASTTYLYDSEESIKNISSAISNWREIKILIVLRDPVKRAFSHYMNTVRSGFEKRSFREVIDSCILYKENRYRNYFAYGLYSKQVEAYLESFKNVKIIIFEELIKNEEDVLRDIYDFLGCKNISDNNVKLLKENSSGRPKFPFVTSLIYKTNLLKWVVKAVIPKSIRKWAVKIINDSMLVKETISVEDMEFLKKHYQEDVKQLESLLGYPIDHWKGY